MDYLTDDDLINYGEPSRSSGTRRSFRAGAGNTYLGSEGIYRYGVRNHAEEDISQWNNDSSPNENLQSPQNYYTPDASTLISSSRNPLNSMTARRLNFENRGLQSGQRIKEIQRSIFSPMRSLEMSCTAPTSHELPESLQPKVLNIISDQVIDQEVLRQKRTLIATGPPQLPDDPSIPQFYEWKSAILRFLELLPGYQIGMLECQPNLDGISNREFKSIVDRYELIFNTLSNATNGNFVVRLKTNAIPRLPFRDLVLWWSEVVNEFQPSDAQIKLLNDEYVACVQKPGQTGTKYLREVEGKADSLKKLGKLYSNEDIGKKVYDGLNLTLKQFVWTNCMAQKIPCDLSSVNTFLKTFEDMEATIQFNHNQFTPMTANATTIRGNSTKNIYTSNNNNNNNMTTGKKVEEFDGSRKIHRDNSFNDARASLNEQKNQSSFEVSGDTADSDINSILNSEVTLTDTEILKNLNIDNAVKNMKYFKKLVRQYNRASGKSNEETNSTSNTTTGDDVVVLPHSKNNATGIQRSRSSPTSTGQKSTSSSSDHYNKRGRYDRSSTVNNSDKSYNSPSLQRNPSQNFDRNERSKSTNRDNRVNRSDSRDRHDSRNARSDNFRRDGDRNFRNNNQSRFSYFLFFSSNSTSGTTCVELTTTFNKNLVRSFESLLHLLRIYNENYNKIVFNLDSLSKVNINNNEEEILRNLKYDSCQGFFQSSRVACHMMTEPTDSFIDTRTDETGAFIYSTSFPDDDPEILIQKECYETIPQNTTPSLVSSSTQISGPSSYVFGVSGKMKFAPQNQLAQLRRSAKDGLVKKIVQAVCKEETKDLDDVPDNDNGEELHPIYSRILQSGHKAAHKVYQEIGKDFMPSQLGYTPVQVLSTCLRWPTESDDVIEDQDNFKTEIDDLAAMCDDGTLTPLDVLGIALVADNEFVKNERIIKSKSDPNPFDYDKDKTNVMFTETKSSLISVGFQNTEIVPYNSTPLPDDHSPAMSLTARYGGTIPRAQTINPDDEAVCVKTTRWVLKQHTHLSPALKVHRNDLPFITSTSLAGVNYHERARVTMENAVNGFYNTIASKIRIETGTQCDLQDSTSQNKELQQLCIEMVTKILNMYTKRINLDNKDKDHSAKLQSTLEMLKDTLSSEALNSTTTNDLSCTTSTDYFIIAQCREISSSNDNKISDTTVTTGDTDCQESESSIYSLIDNAILNKSFKRVPNSRELYAMIKKMHPKLYRFSDPHDLIPTFLTTEWDTKVLYCANSEEYPWYLHVPYIHLLIYHRDSIDLTIMCEPPPSILEEAYNNLVHTSNGKELFYAKLMKLLEKNHHQMIITRILSDPLVANHPDPQKKLIGLIQKPWYEQCLYIAPPKSDPYEWYMYPPFLYITTILKDTLNLASWDNTPRYVIEDILCVAYNDLKSKTSVEMVKFYNRISTALKLYENSKISKNKPSTTSTDSGVSNTNLDQIDTGQSY